MFKGKKLGRFCFGRDILPLGNADIEDSDTDDSDDFDDTDDDSMMSGHTLF